ncbi:MAG: lysophospholipid acyltransferase family protein [Planctomycetota bacterium]
MIDGQANDGVPAVSARWVRLLLWYGPRYVRKHFSAVRLLGDVPTAADGRPVLIYMNHPSWWDPMAIMVLIDRYFRGRRHYGPIDAAALSRYRFMAKLGFFGIDPGTRAGAARFLRVGEAVLSRPGGTLWVTAQGEFTDARERPVRLRPGVAHLARRCGAGPIRGASVEGPAGGEAGAVAWPLAVEYGFGQEKQAEMRLAFGEPVELGAGERSVAAWRGDLEGRLTEAMDRLASASVEAVTGPGAGFTVLNEGTRGVGGVYDVWRRLRAWGRGERFDPAHGAAEPGRGAG